MGGRTARRVAIVGVSIAGCYDTHLHRSSAEHTDSGNSSSGTTVATASGGSEGPSTTVASATSASGTADSTGTSGTPTSGPDESTGSVPETCGNGDHDPGELCFGELERLDFDPGTVDVVIGNLDDDGILDLGVASGDTIGLRVGDGVGGFGNLESWDPTGTAVAITSGDFDHDDFGDAMALAQPIGTVMSYSYGWDFYQWMGNGQALDAYNDLVVGAFDDTYSST